jgi:cell shape-determining protein MreC
MYEEEIQEALKIIKEPITVNSIEYKYFDQENYEKLLRVYENCRWFISNAEQFMQNFKNQQQELDQYKNNWEELKKWVKANDEHYAEALPFREVLNKMKELEESK